MTVQGARGQDLPRCVHRLADPALGQASTRTAPARVAAATTSSGRATSTSRSPPARGRRPRRRRSRGHLAVHPPAAGRRARSRRTPTSTARPDQSNVQLDETAFPIILAWQLGRTDERSPRPTSARPPTSSSRAAPRRRRSAGRRPAATPPSTMAAQIAGLDGGGRHRPPARRRRRAPPSSWASPTTGSATPRSGCSPPPARRRRPATTSASTATATPTTVTHARLRNAAGVHEERAVVDAGFLELVRLGVKAPNDPVRRRLAPRDRRVAGHRHPERPHVAPLHLRRLRREGRRLAVDPRDPRHRPRSGRCCPASAASTSSPTAATRSRTCARWPTRQRRLHDPRAGRGTSPSPPPYGSSVRQGHRLGRRRWRGRWRSTSASLAASPPAARSRPRGWPGAGTSPAARLTPPTADRDVTGRRAWPTADTDRSAAPGRTDGRAVYVGVNGQNRRDRGRRERAARRRPRSTSSSTSRTSEPAGRCREGRTRCHQHGDPHRGVVRQPHRRLRRSRGRRQRAGHVRLSRPTRCSARGLSTSPVLDVYDRGDQVVFVTRIAGDDREPVRRRPDLPPAHQRLPRWRRRRARCRRCRAPT